jgi:hypothetical protein
MLLIKRIGCSWPQLSLSSLAETKHPRPVAFVKQDNISKGPQQVNNGSNETVRVSAPAQANRRNRQTNVWRRQKGERRDGRAAGETSRVNAALATMRTIDGTRWSSHGPGYLRNDTLF